MLSGMATPGVDTHLLHWTLWEQRGNDDLVELSQKELGERLGVGRARAGHLVTDMLVAGRLAKTKTRSRYRVADPAGWAEDGSKRSQSSE